MSHLGGITNTGETRGRTHLLPLTSRALLPPSLSCITHIARRAWPFNVPSHVPVGHSSFDDAKSCAFFAARSAAARAWS
jgi:hypothetical protein